MQQLDRPRRRLATALAGLAGFVDAIGFLSAGGYFVSFMSGNSTRLRVDLVTRFDQAALPAALIAGFVGGVVLGAVVADSSEARRKTRVLALAVGLLTLAAALQPVWHAGFLGATVLAMGALNNVFRRNGEVAVGVTYMTDTLVRLGQGLAALLRGRETTTRLSAGLLWLGLTGGAVAGALAFEVSQLFAPWMAAGWALILAIAAWRLERENSQSPS